MSCSVNSMHVLKGVAGLAYAVLCLAQSNSASAQPAKPRATLEGHADEVMSLSFSPNGKILASGSRDDSIKFWDVAVGRNTVTLKEKNPYLWASVAFRPKGSELAIGGWFNKAKLWDMLTFKSTMLIDDMRQCPPPIFVFSPDGKTLASGGMCRAEILLFDVASGKFKITLVDREESSLWGAQAMVFTPDSKTLISAGRPREIRLWDVASGKNTATRQIDSIAHAAAFTPDGKTLATAVWTERGHRSTADHVKLWTVATGKERTVLEGHTADLESLAFSPDGRTLASGCRDGTIKVWDVATGKERTALAGHSGAVFCLAFSPDGKTLASGGADKIIKLWDVPRAK